MNRVLSVCFLVLTVIVGVSVFVLDETSAGVKAAGQTNPPLQRGISVKMAETKNATAMPEADRHAAWVVSITADGDVYFGTDQVTPETLIDKMTKTPRNRAAGLYVKADARAPFSEVQQVLQAARVCLFDNVVLLTSQPGPAQPGTIVPPKGLEVWIDKEAGANVVTVQVGSREGSPTVKINSEDVAPSALQERLGQVFDNRAGRIVLLKAAGQAPYAQAVNVIDACRGAGASRVAIVVESGI
jgi:biopolymer transport protein ExbD